MPLTPITPCPCCDRFDCLNIDHNPYQTAEYNALASQWRGEANLEEFHGKQRNGHMQSFHKQRRQHLEHQMAAIRIH